MAATEGEGRQPIIPVSYTGASRLTIHHGGEHSMRAVVPCRFDELGVEVDALLDTGATFCVMRADVAKALQLAPLSGDPVELRHGETTYAGALHRCAVRVPALEGRDLQAEPAWFVSDDWYGPLVLGWVGFLEGMRAFGCIINATPEAEGRFCFLPGDAPLAPY
jgi:hypothetical protein